MEILRAIWEALEPHLIEAAVGIVTAGAPLVIAWLRSRTQRLVTEQAATEAEATGHREGLSGGEKMVLALRLARSRMSPFTRPSDDAARRMIERSLPAARMSSPPPADEDELDTDPGA